MQRRWVHVPITFSVCVQFFALLGWRDDDQPSEEAVTDELLDRLVE